MSALAETLIQTMTLLSDVLRQEAACARANDPVGVKALLERKSGLSRGYEEAARTWRLTPDAAASVAPEILVRLRAAAEGFQAAVEENASAIKASMTVSQNIVDAIVIATKQIASSEAGYAAGRSRAGTGGVYRKPAMTSATLNQTF